MLFQEPLVTRRRPGGCGGSAGTTGVRLARGLASSLTPIEFCSGAVGVHQSMDGVFWLREVQAPLPEGAPADRLARSIPGPVRVIPQGALTESWDLKFEAW